MINFIILTFFVLAASILLGYIVAVVSYIIILAIIVRTFHTIRANFVSKDNK